MKTGEARPVEKLKAVQRGRKISNLTISLIFSCVVTAAAQSGRLTDFTLNGTPGQVTTATGSELRSDHAPFDHVKEKTETAIVTLGNGKRF